MYKHSIIDRLTMMFDGWASLFDKMPTWRPRISIEKKDIFVSDHFFCHTDTYIEGVRIDHDCIQVLYNDEIGIGKEVFIYIDIPFDGSPEIEVEVTDNPSGTFSDL